jgi:hypothetical protein
MILRRAKPLPVDASHVHIATKRTDGVPLQDTVQKLSSRAWRRAKTILLERFSYSSYVKFFFKFVNLQSAVAELKSNVA